MKLSETASKFLNLFEMDETPTAGRKLRNMVRFDTSLLHVDTPDSDVNVRNGTASYKYYGAVFINGVRHDAYGGPRSAEPNIVDDSLDKIEEMMGGVFSDRSLTLGSNYTITKEGNELKKRWSARPGVEAKRAEKERLDKFFDDAQDRRAGAAAQAGPTDSPRARIIAGSYNGHVTVDRGSAGRRSR
jgi:hypothetical protein